MTSMNYIKKSYIQPSAAIIVNLTTEFLAASGNGNPKYDDAMNARTKGTDMCTWEDEEDDADDGEYREYEVQWNYGW